MTRNDAKYLSVFLVVFLLVVWINARSTENPWEVTFERGDSQAYGSSMLYNTMPYLFKNKEVMPVAFPPYELLADTSLVNTNYIFVTRALPLDDVAVEVLMRYVHRGNHLFIAAERIPERLGKRLRVRTDLELLEETERLGDLREISVFDTTRINFVDPSLAQSGGYFYSTDWLFSTIQSALEEEDEEVEDEEVEDEEVEDEAPAVEPVPMPYEVLGKYEGGGYNFIRVPHGAGTIYISSVPLAFTNFNMLQTGNEQYAYAALSYLPEQRTFWDAYHKPGRSLVGTPLRYILSSSALKVAYYLALGGLLLYMITAGRRRQREMPIVAPKENKTLEFATTVGRLYFTEGDHTNLAGKLLDQFKHYVHHKLRLPTPSIKDVQPSVVAARSGVPIEQVEILLKRFTGIEAGRTINEAELNILAGELDQFYNASTR